jgi:TonB-dependent starch-binding outer membrane protein SusC
MNIKKTTGKLNLSIFLTLIFMCAQAPFSSHIFGNIISNETKGKQQNIRGKISDEDGQPLPGANIMVVGTAMGTITDLNGEFTINNVSVGARLKISFIGYNDLEILVTGEYINVQLLASASELQQVVVVGYGNQKKEDVTGAVSLIEARDFKTGITTSADNLIQGKIAGVRISNPSGEPGAGVDVIIRGLGSIRSGSTPLFVVDGVPLSNDDVTPGGGSVGYGSAAAKNPLNFLNTSDIESINVLKDASSAAIYGARGSNGVVIITTKKGTEGKSSFTLNLSTSLSELSNKLDVLTGDEYRAAVSESSSYNHGSSTDWQDEVFRKAFTNNAEFSFSKKTKSGNYYASIGNMNQEGIIHNSEFTRTSARLNAEESFLDDKRLKIKMNLTASQMIENGVPTSSNAASNGQLITQTLMANPTQPVYDEDGDYTSFNLDACYNPVYMLHIYEDEINTLRVLGNIEASFRILKGLEYKFNYALDRSFSKRSTAIYENTTEINPDGLYTQTNLDNKTKLLEHYLTYDFHQNKHQLNLLGGFSYQYYVTENTYFSAEAIGEKGEGINPKYDPTYSGTVSDLSGSAQENELQSYFTRANYIFASKYMLTASVRADGSTRFGENNKYGYFPSFALGWNISNENFMKSKSFVNNLKLRTSWGQTGNQEVENKITQASYSLSNSTGYYLTDGTFTNGISVARTANPDLKWEVVTQYDIGLDFSMLNGKLHGTLDYYNKVTTDAILYVTAEVLSATSSVWRNIDGKIINKGFEFDLGGELLATKNFRWSIDVNGSTLKNVVKNLPETLYSGSLSGSGLSGTYINIYKSNYEIGSFYLYKHLGFNEDGTENIADTDGDESISSSDRVIVEGALPNFYYGINSNFSYKNLDLSFSIIGQTGGMLYNNTALTALNVSNLQSDRNTTPEYLNSGAGSSYTAGATTYYLEKSDFIRLNTVRLGYNFNTSKLKASWLKGLNISLTAQNLFTITGYSGYDPMANSDKSSDGNQSVGIDYTVYPSARTYTFALTLNL